MEFRAHQDSSDIPGETIEASKRALERTEAIVHAELKRGLGGLATIGSTAPFVGLFGTVMGILNAFKGISQEKATGLAAVAGGIAEALVTIGTIVHGGAIASLIDTAAAVAAWSNAEVPANGRGTTVNLTVAYLAPALKEDLQAVARVLRRGRNLVYLDVEVSNAAGSAIAKGLVTYKLG